MATRTLTVTVVLGQTKEGNRSASATLDGSTLGDGQGAHEWAHRDAGEALARSLERLAANIRERRAYARSAY